MISVTQNTLAINAHVRDARVVYNAYNASLQTQNYKVCTTYNYKVSKDEQDKKLYVI